MKYQVGIVDYNMGNLASVINAFEKIGVHASVESSPSNLNKYDKLVLPGVGAFGNAMKHLRANGIDKAVIQFAQSGKPLLGICLGMQLLFESSEEFGNHDGLGLIEGEVKLFDKTLFDHALKIPHMGWNEMFVTKSSPIFEGLRSDFYLYFVHSYHVVCDEEFVTGVTNYGYEFVSSVKKGNIYGFQPHPEKSHDNGLKILENFTKL